MDTGRVWDVVASARYLRQILGEKVTLVVAGQGSAAVLAAYAALLEPGITGVVLRDPVVSHTSASAPQFLNVLRVCDVPEAFGMLAPRPLTIQESSAEALKKVQALYAAAGATERLVLQ